MSAEPTRPVRRRTLLATGATLGAIAPLTAWNELTAEADVRPMAIRYHRGSVLRALSFLVGVADAHYPSGPRLVQSYQDDSGLGDIGFVYDNALTTIAMLVGGHLKQARAIGDALLFAQTHDEKFTDGRLRQAYHAKAFVNGQGTAKETAHFGWEFGLTGTAVGDMAWSGIALAQLAHRTGAKSYRDGSVAIGKWIVANTRSTTGLGGYTFGETAGLEGHKSTEHNIDVYAFFHLLATLTGDQTWIRNADHAWQFVTRMWNPAGGFLWTGSDDGAAVNKATAQLPLDVQAWSWLAARQAAYGDALDWARTNLVSTDTPLRKNSKLTGTQTVHGAVFASGTLITDTDVKIGGLDYTPKPDDGAVWFEGTGQLALALRNRGRSGDVDRSDALLGQLRYAQSELGRHQTFGGKRLEGGLVAASSPLDTGFKFGYYPDLHVAATSWYVFAATGFNPYRFPSALS